MAAKLALLAVACCALANAGPDDSFSPSEMALMKEELGNDGVFAGVQTSQRSKSAFTEDADNSLEDLLSDQAPNHNYSPRLRELASEILDDDSSTKTPQAPKPVVEMAAVKKHEAPKPVVEMAAVKKHEAVAALKAAPAKASKHAQALFPLGELGAGSMPLMDALEGIMLAKSGDSATPMGDTTKQIKTLIEKEMLPKILNAHTADQNQLDKLAKEVAQCATTKNTAIADADRKKVIYLAQSPLHKTCRVTEAELFQQKTTCHEELTDKKEEKQLKCAAFKVVGDKWADEAKNKAIVTKSAGETQETYIRRIHLTYCKPSALDEFLLHKERCSKATKIVEQWQKKCNKLDTDYANQKTKCNNIQKLMDNAACSRAVKTKDACETFSECYNDKKATYLTAETSIKKMEKDRQTEWRATKRMQCYIEAFVDGKVEDSEVKLCKDKTHSTNHLVINYPKIKDMDVCQVPKLYPMTAEYKKAEFAPLPVLAKGNADADECVGVREISTTPADGSPKTCKCERLTLNGPFSPGALLKCTDCLDVRRSGDKNSCPSGTKLFAPTSRGDWATMLASGAAPLRAPHWIIDVTRPQNGCGGCTGHAFNSGNNNQKSWVTADKSPWWLRSTRYNEPNGDYHANCYLDLWHKPANADGVTWNDGNCNYHSKSYYCQPKKISTTPKAGSPSGCNCAMVETTGTYSPGALMKCTACLDVHKATQKNSCPEGTKLFSPRTRADWQTFIDSAGPLRSPHWIIDVTRPQNGCGGCTRAAMNSGVTTQATWRTADNSPWWLRSSRYNEPNGDYHANCYLDLWHNPANSDSVTWNDGNCNYHANAYYCQQAKR